MKTSRPAVASRTGLCRVPFCRVNSPHACRADKPCVHRYKVVKQLGDGTYGTVWKAINRQSNEVVSCRATGWV